ncbi:unnamed protein product [Cunninghamella blakesleeana]
MKVLSIGLVALSVYAAVCKAGCECKPSDAACIETCVKEANSCVLECHGKTDCYQDCIDNSWPSAEMFKHENEENTKNHDSTIFDPTHSKNNATDMINTDANNNAKDTLVNPLAPTASADSPLANPSSNNLINQQATSASGSSPSSSPSSSVVHPHSSGASSSVASNQPTSSTTHSSSNILQVSTTILLVSSLCGMVMNMA